MMLEYGFDVHPIADGEFHRFKGPGDKRPNGWYVFHGDHGAFGNHKMNLKVPWSLRRTRTAPADRRKLIARERAERARQDAIKHSDAARKARLIWQASDQATEHPYLTRKLVKPHGLRMQGDRLVIPMTIDKHIHSIQYIHSDGDKKFMRGGRVKGCYYPIGTMTNQIWVAEGFATAATVFEVTGVATVCAFNAGNLAPVTKHFVAKGLDVFIAADNDADTNSGWIAAGQARLVGAKYRAAPEFGGDQKGDWNDYFALNGAENTLEGLYGA